MNLNTNLRGRLRNTSLPASSGLLPLFEAVVNSIHAIDDAFSNAHAGQIIVRIERDGQSSLPGAADIRRPGPDSIPEISSFVVTDNGAGFNDENMQSFLTLDSDHKLDRGGRGVGRLLWLKAFEYTTITSVFDNSDGQRKRRSFRFDAHSGVTQDAVLDAGDADRWTTVSLIGYTKRFLDATPKSATTLAKRLFEHCLWYFIRPGGAPRITVLDGGEQISLETIYEEHMLSASLPDTTVVKGVAFDLTHIKLAAASSRSHSISFCAGSRLVLKESLKGRLPGLYGPLQDDKGDFVYECYVSSPFLDARVRSERTGFDILEEPLELLSDAELSLKEIREAVVAKSAEFLKTYLEEKRRLGEERVSSFVAHKAPRYRPILARIPPAQLVVDPAISDRDLELMLHKHLADIESQMLADGHDILNSPDQESLPDYGERLDNYLKKAEDIKKSDLANYVSHRRVIIDLLEKAIRQRADGSYEPEEVIHKLIMPMRTDTRTTAADSCNLWLIDERLAFHDYMASDKPLSAVPITESTSGKEPDIVALNVFDNPLLVTEGRNLPPASLVVVELKRPMRNNAAEGEDKDPIEQALGYLDRIRQGKVRTESGRPISQSENVPGFCYVLCDLTSTILSRCRMHDAIRTSDGMGYFFYHKACSAYVEVISFDRLVNAAKERNRAFFDKLGLPAV